MGCDIHLAVERRNGNAWERVLPPPEVYDPWLLEQARARPDDAYYNERVKVVWFDDRNYNLFAILADVRNYFGFAPISKPRGLPSDMSPALHALAGEDVEIDALDAEIINDAEDEETNDVSLGDHSQTWLTLRDLLNYNWNREVKEGGWVDPWNFELWRKNGKPNAWCRSVGGGRVEHVSYVEMARKIDEGDIVFEGPEPQSGSFDGRAYTDSLSRTMQTWDLPKGSVGARIAQGRSYYCYVEWSLSYKEAAGRFYDQIIPVLEQLGSPDDVRIVFGFDS